ncbi:winged helix DNA-binding domain-containing protein [Gordonia sp. SID5947]|uniref:winged helix DNA-binding domain-containing protein n=1 Tax=Gordonia sp. SID5947 TaxID=2690315 RepID=UPI001370E805|nr:winged helix DNA-binding domain-containing protein [Gordonia sp. SID5947]MYR07003.1 winged helix DNA-binding domain-containing protein [Gordonia sp. SID5947]
MAVRPAITDAQRRARLVRRHRLAAGAEASSVTDLADALVGYHATTPSTVYLSAWARIPGFLPKEMDTALYDDRTLIKQLAMRRTLFVFTRPVLAAAVGAVGPRVTASERTNMLRDLRRSPGFDDPDAWIDVAHAAVDDDLADGASRTSTQLRERLPALDGYVIQGVGTKWEARTPMGPRVLNMMSAAGDIVRGPNFAGRDPDEESRWHVSRPSWSSMTAWLGEPLPLVTVEDGHKAMIEHWLRSFGPGTETDLVWWLGSTKGAVRTALAALDVVEVDLERGEIGYVLADDIPGDVAADEPADPVACLLPELDPTTMGWKQRDFYLGRHGEQVFDRNGNGGQTAWWDGRIVGGWRQRKDDGRIEVHPLEKLPRAATRALAERAAQLEEWLGEVRPSPGYPAPFMRA